jgi:hypothetical protein
MLQGINIQKDNEKRGNKRLGQRGAKIAYDRADGDLFVVTGDQYRDAWF